MKLVSVIIPAYNAEKYISDAITSVLSQTYSNFELIIINDGSTDKTDQLIRSFLPNAKINYILQKNSGVSNSRNTGMQNAKGDYFSFLDADDYFEPDNLLYKVNALEQHSNCFFCYSDVSMCNENFNIISFAKSYGGENLLERMLLWDGTVIPSLPSNIVIKKQCYTNGLLFDNELSTAADQMFAFLIAHRYNGFCINQSLVKYRVLSNSMSRNILLMENDHILVYNKAKTFGLFKSFWFQKKCFANLYLILAGSWWVNGKNKWKGFFYILKALIVFPPIIIKLIKKIRG